jgi:AraC-like DNA-binding protein
MPRNVSKVREALEAALKEDPPPSLLEVAEKLGYKNANSLRYTSQTLCKEVTARYKLWLKASGKVLFSTKKLCDENTVIKALENALRQECPPTVVEIASNLGYRSSHTLYRKFPDLCYLITNKRTEWFEIHSKNVRLALEKVISEEPPPSLAAVIKRAGLKNSRWVCRSFPELTSAIVARHAEWKVKCEEQVRANLQTALARNPPPSLSQVAEQHGYKILNLYQKHGEVCSEISARYAAYQKRVRNERRESYKAEVRKVVINLRELGVYPSIAQVSKNIEDPPTKNSGVLQKILRELKQELI